MKTAHKSKAAQALSSNEGGELNTSDYTQLLIDPKEAAKRLSLGSRTRWSLKACGAIPSLKIGKSVRFSVVELEAWIAAGCPTEPGSAERIRKGGHNER